MEWGWGGEGEGEGEEGDQGGDRVAATAEEDAEWVDGPLDSQDVTIEEEGEREERNSHQHSAEQQGPPRSNNRRKRNMGTARMDSGGRMKGKRQNNKNSSAIID